MNPGLEFLKRFMLLQAFSPDPQNPSLPLLQRVGKQKIALLSIGPCGLKIGSYSKSKGISDLEAFPMRLSDDAQDTPILTSLAKKTDCGLVAVCAGWKFAVNTDANKFKSEAELNIELGSSPQTVLASRYQPNRRFMGLLSSDAKYQIVGDMEEDSVQNVEDSLASYGMRVMRVQIGLMSMLRAFFENPSIIPESPEAVPVLHDNGHVLVLLRAEGRIAVRLFAGVVDPRPDNQPVERATKLTERLADILRNQRQGRATEFVVIDSGLPKIDLVMQQFVSSVRHDAKVTTRTVEIPGNDLEFQGLLLQ
jgi:hypothetical protein